LRDLNNGDSGGGQGNIVINMVIKAWDSQDIFRNRKSLAQAIGAEVQSNGALRGVLRRYA